MGTKLPVTRTRRPRRDPRPRRHRQWLAIGATIFTMAACGGGGGGGGGPAGPNPPTPNPPTTNPPAEGNTVAIQDNLFSPATRNVSVGTTVRWVNNGSTVHNTISNTGVWTSSNLNPSAEFTHTFNTTGTFPYRCTLHAGMTGTIVVES